MSLWLVAEHIQTGERRWHPLGPRSTRVGRSGGDDDDKFCVDFDASLSRSHAVAWLEDGGVRVRREGRNALYMGGQALDEFHLEPGQFFTSGQTRFRVASQGPPSPQAEQAFTLIGPARAEARTRDAHRCLQALLDIQPLLARLHEPRAFFVELLPLLHRIVPAATDLMACRITDADDGCETLAYVGGERPPAPSRTLVRAAIELREPAGHVWTDLDTLAPGMPTVSVGVHWALAAPILGGDQPCVLYAVGREEPLTGVAHATPGDLDRAVLSLVAEVVSQALASREAERLALVVEFERQRRSLSESLHDLIQTLSSTLDVGEVLARLLETLHRVVPVRHSVALLADVEGLLRATVERGPSGAQRPCGLLIDAGDPRLEALREAPAVLDALFPCQSHGTHDMKGWLAIALTSSQQVEGLLLLEPPARAFTEEETSLASVFAGQAGIALQNARLFQEMTRLAVTDPLTGIANRRRLWTQATERFGPGMALLGLDIDHFKHINDTWGHACGDDVLVEVVRRCGRVLRPEDAFGRCGGEEFTIVLHTSEAGASAVAERLLMAVSGAPVRTRAGHVPVTLSIGIAVHDGAVDGIEALMKRADDALYRAKQGGRNRWVLHEG